MDDRIAPNANGDVFRNMSFIENRSPVDTKQLQFLSIYDGKQRNCPSALLSRSRLHTRGIDFCCRTQCPSRRHQHGRHLLERYSLALQGHLRLLPGASRRDAADGQRHLRRRLPQREQIRHRRGQRRHADPGDNPNGRAVPVAVPRVRMPARGQHPDSLRVLQPEELRHGRTGLLVRCFQGVRHCKSRRAKGIILCPLQLKGLGCGGLSRELLVQLCAYGCYHQYRREAHMQLYISVCIFRQRIAIVGHQTSQAGEVYIYLQLFHILPYMFCFKFVTSFLLFFFKRYLQEG